MLTLAIPLALFVVTLSALYQFTLPGRDLGHVAMVASTVVVLGIALVMALADVPIAWCIVAIVVAPWLIVVGYELGGYRQVDARLAHTEA